ncbi:MAG: glycosyltransferase family 2 protein [Fimbriimonadales bacterium]
MSKPAVAVIIPAYNEEQRIGAVLRAVTQCKLVTEIIVVSDASGDRTAQVARGFDGVRVLELPFNSGKGGAMSAGVEATKAEIITFVDADLTNLKPEHIDRIIQPILADACDMCIGVFRGGKFWSDTAQRISPYISGQRALKRWIFDQIPFISEMRMGVEVTINTYAKRNKARVMRVVLHGVSNTFKESKMGLMKGVKARGKMYAEIGRALVRMRRKNKSKTRRAQRRSGRKSNGR